MRAAIRILAPSGRRDIPSLTDEDLAARRESLLAARERGEMVTGVLRAVDDEIARRSGAGENRVTDEETHAAWKHLEECLRTLNDLATGCMHWSERFSEEVLPPGMPLQEAAIQLAAGEADEARRALLLKGADVPDEVGS